VLSVMMQLVHALEQKAVVESGVSSLRQRMLISLNEPADHQCYIGISNVYRTILTAKQYARPRG